jgi:hypothetical protein
MASSGIFFNRNSSNIRFPHKKLFPKLAKNHDPAQKVNPGNRHKLSSDSKVNTETRDKLTSCRQTGRVDPYLALDQITGRLILELLKVVT